MKEPSEYVNIVRQVAVLEERMVSMNERYDKGWKLVQADIREGSAKLREDSARLREDGARLREDIAKRDTANTRWFIGMIAAATAIIIAVMSVLLPNAG